MGAIAEAIVAFAQPLLEQTDGSEEQLNKAFALSQACYNLALLPKEDREAAIDEMRSSLAMDDEEFAEFRRELVDPMIQRHERMFPLMHRRISAHLLQSRSLPGAYPTIAEHPETPPPPSDRYAPCPCNSGRKYKFCCGAKRR
jgi:hypothetical protein